MNSGKEDSFDYCADLVRRLDEDRWLAAQYAPPVRRRHLLALYALHLEIAEIPTKVSEAALGEIRLQWWREALAEIAAGGATRAHPVIEAARAAGVIDAEARASFGAAIDARARLLYQEPFAGIDDLAAWLRQSEAYLAPLAARIGGLTHDLENALLGAGTAFELARKGAQLAPDLEEIIPAHARALLVGSKDALSGLSPEAAPAALHLALTRSYLAGQGRFSPIARRWRLFTAMASGRF